MAKVLLVFRHNVARQVDLTSSLKHKLGGSYFAKGEKAISTLKGRINVKACFLTIDKQINCDLISVTSAQGGNKHLLFFLFFVLGSYNQPKPDAKKVDELKNE